jgi:hypothetical protein
MVVIRYAQKRKIGKPNNLKVFGSNKTKELTHDSQVGQGHLLNVDNSIHYFGT